MTSRIKLFGIDFDPIGRTAAVALIGQWLDSEERRCRYVVTPNVNHVVRLDGSPEFQAAYAAASLVVADGWPVVAASRWLGRPLPETVPGSDLVPAILARLSITRAAALQPLRVFLLGAAPGVADRAAHSVEAVNPGVRIVGTCAPPFGFASDAGQCAAIIEQISRSDCELLVIGLGAPLQELWVQRHAAALDVKVALCVGATIDFLAGHKPRAPMWMRQVGLEWLHRAMSEPRRLAGRYLHDGLRFPALVWREWRRQHSLTTR